MDGTVGIADDSVRSRGRRKLPPLNALRAFDIAARQGSFTAAAAELRVSQAAVSRHISALEDIVGLKLFHRSHRKVTLTREGRSYSMAVAAALDDLERATDQLRREREAQLIAITAFPTMAARWLVPRIGSFLTQHPLIDVQITSSRQAANFGRDSFDFAIEFERPRQHGVRYDPLFEREVVPVCSPALLSGPDPITRPQDLFSHVLLHASNRPDDFGDWLRMTGILNSQEVHRMKFSSSFLAFQAAINGVGFAMAHPKFIVDDLAAGRLVMPFPQPFRTGRLYYLLSHDSDHVLPNVASFREWVLSEARRGPLNPQSQLKECR